MMAPYLPAPHCVISVLPGQLLSSWPPACALGGQPMSENSALFATLRQFTDPRMVDVMQRLVQEAPDHELNRINVLAFAARHHLEEERTIAAFLHAARLGLF